MATLTECEQAKADLASLKSALVAIAAGRTIEVSSGADHTVRWAPGNAGLLRTLIREKQAQVDACTGVRSRGRFLNMTASDR